MAAGLPVPGRPVDLLAGRITDAVLELPAGDWTFSHGVDSLSPNVDFARPLGIDFPLPHIPANGMLRPAEGRL